MSDNLHNILKVANVAILNMVGWRKLQTRATERNEGAQKEYFKKRKQGCKWAERALPVQSLKTTRGPKP